jgi:hypothetical protein
MRFGHPMRFGYALGPCEAARAGGLVPGLLLISGFTLLSTVGTPWRRGTCAACRRIGGIGEPDKSPGQFKSVKLRPA